jgi:DNA-directed RNA polymerase subunit RPC12/RpoP
LPVSANERTVFWCEECGTEVQLVVRGTQRAPSHCGQRMNERTELLDEA